METTMSKLLRLNLFTLAGSMVILSLMISLLAPVVEARTNEPKPRAPESAIEAIAQIKTADGRLAFDVAEDMSRFVYDTSVAHEDGMPKHGSSFITQGYIYPAGTLTESNGVNADGSPEFPELVLGEWTCRGWFVGEGAHAKEGPMVITTQLFNFGPDLGDATLVSEGYELAEPGVYIERAITGGTGPYAYARGMGRQAFLGFNATEGVNLTLSFEVIGLSPIQSPSSVND
jgi:hypothetical protein